MGAGSPSIREGQRTEAMFPLGTVLLPTAFLPLNVFEPRYRTMLVDLLEGSRLFGVVLIERGSEVGGGEVRTEVGTMARIVEARPAADDGWLVAVVGMQRIQVVRWLPDDPYPTAVVEDLPDVEEAVQDASVETTRFRDLVARQRRILAHLSELGQSVTASTFECSEDPALGTFQLAALGPFGPFDRQRLLAATRASDRLGLIDGYLGDLEAVVAHRMDGNGGGAGTQG
ncbi:MAG: LON peptidase substrate-binding domain-containing protein [Acidimicrobiales bacterium]|nr:LON peptidase substrate-binding domain-containing protein [Acidimicrobiales bacterium]